MSAVTLTLMRHAKSSWQTPGQADHDRPLNDRGNRDAPIMGERLMQGNSIPDLILCSSATRAKQTTAHLLSVFGDPQPSVQFQKLLYLSSPHSMITLLESVPDNVGHVMIVAHNPGLEELSALLSGAVSDIMPTASVRQFSCPSFSDLLPRTHNATRNTRDTVTKLVLSDYPKNL